MKIVIDTREQQPYLFTSINPVPETIVSSLNTGDYSIYGFEDQIVVERKSLADAFQTFGKGRTRFVNELERMTTRTFAAVVIEADWVTILRRPPARSRLNPRSVYASIIAWTQRYGVHFFLCPNRPFAEKTTYRILERFYKDHEKSIDKCHSLNYVA